MDTDSKKSKRSNLIAQRNKSDWMKGMFCCALYMFVVLTSLRAEVGSGLISFNPVLKGEKLDENQGIHDGVSSVLQNGQCFEWLFITETIVQFLLLYSWRFSRYSAPIHWLVHCHMTYNNAGKCFPPNAMSGQHCENYDVKQETVHCYPRNVDRCCTSFVNNVIICSPPLWPICFAM